MSFDFEAFRGTFSVRSLFDLQKFKRNFKRSNPDYFYPDGTILFCGKQGSGKTLSAVRYIERIAARYPKALIVSNITLNLDVPNEVIPYEGLTKLSEMDNGTNGIICLIDEIQTEFNSLESKKISPSVLAMISQQRKRRAHLVGTTQLFGRVAKPFREQCSAAVDCTTIFAGLLQRNHVIDLNSCLESDSGTLQGYNYSWHATFVRDPRLFDKYDTYQRIFHQGFDS